MRKPGALQHALVLKHSPDLKTLYELYYKEKPREFLEKLDQYRELPKDQLLHKLSLASLVPEMKLPSTKAEAITDAIEADWQLLNRLYGLERVYS